MDDGRIDDLLDHVRGLEQRLAAQERELEGLRARVGTSPGRSEDPPAVPAMGRRRLLVGGATAAAAGVAGLVATGQPAAAAAGDPLVLGEDNTAGTAATTLAADLPDDAVLAVSNDATAEGAGDAIGAILGATTIGYGVRGSGGIGTGVEGIGETGVSGRSAFPDGTGVSASANDGTGLRASGLTGVDAYGSGEFDTAAIRGYATQGAGVLGQSAQTWGLVGRGATGLWAEGTDVAAMLNGTRTHIRLELPTGGRTAPTADTTEHQVGDIVLASSGVLWACVASGTPGTWRTVSGPGAAGQLHLLPAPVRVYDSRPGGVPAIGPKTKLVPDTPRTIDCRANASGVPAGATAVEVTLLVVNAPAGPGNLTIWAGGAPRPQANAMVWGGNAGRFSSPATTRVDGAGKVQVVASVATHLALDVVGYHL